MRRRALTLLFVLLTAPIWAPSSAFAAKANTLTAASVTPLAGTPETIFSFAVTYSGAASAPAQSVSADVAGKSVALTLILGTRVQGTWAGSSRLPTGTWSVTFTAKLLTGKKQTVRGPTVVVAGATSNPGGPSGGAGGGGPAASPVAAPGGTAATPAPGSGTTTATPPGAPSSNPAPGSPTPRATGTGGAPTPQQPGSGGAGSNASTRPAPGAGATRWSGPATSHPDPASSTVASARSSAQPSRTSNPLGLDDQAASLRLTVELVGVAVLSLLGLLLARRRRRHAEAMATPHATPHPLTPPPNLELDLSRRSRAAARKRMDPGDDPILRAMGLDPEAPAAAGASKLRARARRMDRQTPGESSPGSTPKPRGRR